MMRPADSLRGAIRRAIWAAHCAVLSAYAAPHGTLAMPPFAVSAQGDASAFATPVDSLNGYLVAVFVTDPSPESPPGYLSTTVRIGKQVNGNWEWQSKVIEHRTLFDPYHTQASVAFDKSGHIHVAFNMHNLPWQYLVSRRPFDISAFEDRGEQVSLSQLDDLRLRNRTAFPQQGNADIPGNQITYPAFFKAANGDLFVSYRFAMKPARAWSERARAYGVARYDADTRSWRPVGAPFPLQAGDITGAQPGSPQTAHPFAYDRIHQPYLVTLAIHENTLHAIWTWWDSRSNQSGNITRYPSYRSIDLDRGTREIADVHAGPIPGWEPNTIFNTAKSLAAAPNGDVLALLEPRSANRMLVRRDHATGRWGTPEATPGSASKILVDRQGTEWAIASGLKVFWRAKGEQWNGPALIGNKLCEPRPVYSAADQSIFVLAKDCDRRDSVVIQQLHLH